MRLGRKCYYRNCTHSTAGNKQSGNHCTFHPFPKNYLSTAQWLKAGGIYHLTPKRVTAFNCFLCSCHFPEGKSGGPVEWVEECDSEDPDPVPELEDEGHSRKRAQSFSTGLTPSTKTMKTSTITPRTHAAVESLLTLQNDMGPGQVCANCKVVYSPVKALWRIRGRTARESARETLKNMADAGRTKIMDTGDDLGVALLPPSPCPETPMSSNLDNNISALRAGRGLVRNILVDMVHTESTQSLDTISETGTGLDSTVLSTITPLELEPEDVNNNVEEEVCSSSPPLDASVQVKEFCSVAVQCNRSFICYDKAKLLPEGDFQFYTGLTQSTFELLFEFLGGEEVCSKLKYNYSRKTPKQKQFQGDLFPKDKLLLTLIRLRRGLPLRDLKILFNVSEGYASRVVYTWVRFMSLEFKKLEVRMFTSAEAQNGLRPKCFRNFPNLRVILDSSEFRIQKPYNFQQQSNTFSDYKSGNTIKFLIGISCFGGLSYISEAVEGSITDRQLLIKSGLLDMLHPHEAAMADKGFDAEDLFDERDLELLIPAFLGNRANFTARELIINRAIAVSRIHVETFIGKLKQNRLVRYIIPNAMLPIASDLVRVCGFMVNFQLPFIKDDDVNDNAAD